MTERLCRFYCTFDCFHYSLKNRTTYLNYLHNICTVSQIITVERKNDTFLICNVSLYFLFEFELSFCRNKCTVMWVTFWVCFVFSWCRKALTIFFSLSFHLHSWKMNILVQQYFHLPQRFLQLLVHAS